MHRKSTQLYWDLVQQTMDREQVNQQLAEDLLLVNVAIEYGRAGWSQYQIGLRLSKLWGFHRVTYQRRLKKARQTVCIL